MKQAVAGEWATAFLVVNASSRHQPTDAGNTGFYK
jgi:hypothetical protein